MATKKNSAQAALLDQDSTQAGVAPSPTNEGLRGSNSPSESGHLYLSRIFYRNFGGVGTEGVTLDFKPGANVIAAPNGGGKTTALDALRCLLRI